MRRAARLPRFPLLPALIILWTAGLPCAPNLPAQAASVQTVSILKPTVYPDSPENRELIGRVIQWSVNRSNDLYERHIAVDYNQRGERADYSVEVMANFSGDDSAGRTAKYRSSKPKRCRCLGG